MSTQGNPSVSSFNNIGTSPLKTVQQTSTATGYALGFNTSNTSGTYGAGGYTNLSFTSGRGYQGNKLEATYTVEPGQSYVIVVGAANGDAGYHATSGFVQLAYGTTIT